MGFMRDLARVGTFGLAGAALSKKKRDKETGPRPSMITSIAGDRPTSMIGPTRRY